MQTGFEEIIENLGKELDIPLQTDNNNSCVIFVEEKISVQIDENKSKILLATFVAALPPGKFRENVLKVALKANGIQKSIGVFAFHEKTTNLAMYSYIDKHDLTASILKDYLLAFVETSINWQEAIDNGNISLLDQNIPKVESSLFKFKP